MRRLLVALMATSLLAAALPGMAVAAPPIRSSDAATWVACNLTDEAGTVHLWGHHDANHGSHADLLFWAAPSIPWQDDPTWITHYGEVSVSPDGTALTATIELVEFEEPYDEWAPTFGDPVGTAVLEADLTPLGDPHIESFTGTFGNRRVSYETTSQMLSVAGTLELPEGILFDAAACEASHYSFDMFATNPAIDVWRSEYIGLWCAWETDDVVAYLSADAGTWGSFSSVFLADASGVYYGFGDSQLSTTAFSATYDLQPDWYETELLSSATGSAEASLTRGERFRINDDWDGVKYMLRGNHLSVDGSLTLESVAGVHQLAMTDADCSAVDVHETVIFKTKGRSGGGGPPVKNDDPARAEEISIGTSLSTSTSRARLEPEAACTVVFDPELDGYDVPLGRTVWYLFEGNGETVTIDTAGSDFDTVVGVYTLEGSTLTQVACVDDVYDDDWYSLQARVELDTVAGVTYYVQVGGYGGSSGTLQLSLH